MSAGTKVFLAVFGLLIVILVIYYGALLPGDTEAEVVFDDREPESEVVEPAPQERPRPSTHDRGEPSVNVSPPPSQQDALPQEAEAEITDPIGRERPDDPITDEQVEVHGEEDDESTEEVRPLGERERERAANGSTTLDDTPSTEAASDAAANDADDGASEANDEPAEDEEDTEEPERPEPATPPAPEYTAYTVQSGDTMSSIAREWFGEPNKWDLIAKANPLVDPNRLRVGLELRLPPKDAEREEIVGEASDSETIYTVRSGDNLSKIARAYYNDSSLWRLIFDANREALRNDPDNIRVGMRLRIPPAPRPADDDEDDE